MLRPLSYFTQFLVLLYYVVEYQFSVCNYDNVTYTCIHTTYQIGVDQADDNAWLLRQLQCPRQW